MATLMPLSWLELCIVVVLAGAAWTAAAHSLTHARHRALLTSSVAFVLFVVSGLDQWFWGLFREEAGFRLFNRILGSQMMVLEPLNLPFLGLVALLSLVTVAVTLKTRVRRFSFARTLLLEACLLLTLAAHNPWVLLICMGVMSLLQAHELLMRGRSIRVFGVHMALAFVLLFCGLGLLSIPLRGEYWHLLGYVCLAGGIAIRAGLWPVHCWVIDYFEEASFGFALLSFAPLVPSYALLRLLLPEAPATVLLVLSCLALGTAVYMAAMGSIQIGARQFLCYFLLSQSSLVLAGLMFTSSLGMIGSLFLWGSVSVSVMALGLVVRCIEARVGRVVLRDFWGLHQEVPILAAFFLIFGLAAVGFPGTLGFFGVEMLTDAAAQYSKIFGFLVVSATALNGIAVVRIYALLFLGKAAQNRSIDLGARRIEIAALFVLVMLLVGGTIYPQAGIELSKQAANNLLAERQQQQDYASVRR